MKTMDKFKEIGLNMLSFFLLAFCATSGFGIGLVLAMKVLEILFS
jgi:hypothetical protein